MTFWEILQQNLRVMRDNGMTNEEIAKKGGISQSYVNLLLNKSPDQFKKIKIETLMLLFPDIFNELVKSSGATSVGNAVANATPVHGNATAINGNVTQSALDGPLLDQLQSAILDDGKMCAECKVRVLQLIKARK
ncbi:MAG: helix-turn-helix transcriptional regulator [Victivallales bacterium]|nr:helix-turn-helix transcriptional regulator [Victivallales bacterium]